MRMCIRGYHVYQQVWEAARGEVLVCSREARNRHNKRYCHRAPTIQPFAEYPSSWGDPMLTRKASNVRVYRGAIDLVWSMLLLLCLTCGFSYCRFASVTIDDGISDQRGPLGSGNPLIGTRYLRIDIVIHTLLSPPSSCTCVASWVIFRVSNYLW